MEFPGRSGYFPLRFGRMTSKTRSWQGAADSCVTKRGLSDPPGGAAGLPPQRVAGSQAFSLGSSNAPFCLNLFAADARVKWACLGTAPLAARARCLQNGQLVSTLPAAPVPGTSLQRMCCRSAWATALPPDAHRQIAWLTGETKENSGPVSGRATRPSELSAAKSEVQAISSRGPRSFLPFLLPTTTPSLYGAVASHSLFLSIRSLHSLPSFSEVHHSFTLFLQRNSPGRHTSTPALKKLQTAIPCP